MGVNALFDYATAMRTLIDDVVSVCDVFGHIDMSSLLVGCIKARSSGRSGLYARAVPLRFEGGHQTSTRNGYRIRIPVVMHEGNEILYIVAFCLPRFQNLLFEDKITTVIHELYHIGPAFDGDVRRFSGSKYLHSSSQKKYDELMREISHEYLSNTKHPELYEFLKYSYRQLANRHDGVRLTCYRPPKPEIIGRQVSNVASAQPKKKNNRDARQ